MFYEKDSRLESSEHHNGHHNNSENSETEKQRGDPVGNLCQHVALPEGYNGKTRRGNLIFDASYETGNLGRVDYITEFEYDLFIRPDTCNPRFRVWFNFTVCNILPGQIVIFNIVNFSKTRSLFRDGMTPLVKSTSRPIWQRLPNKNIFYYRSPEHRKNYVISFAFAFDKVDDVYQFAYCFPYTYSKLQGYLSSLERRQYDFFQRDKLCNSVQQRRVDIITITSPTNLDDIAKRKKVVFITARVHPGETPSSFVCQGLIDFLTSRHPAACVLRDNLIFKIVPMLNPDGVVLGNYRCSLMGFDLNRFWQEPSPWAHPTIVATKDYLLNLDQKEDYDLDFYIDFHAHSTQLNAFMYGNLHDNEQRYEKHIAFPKLFCINAHDFSLSNTNYNRDAIKAGTGRRSLANSLTSECHCYTLEVSFYGFNSLLNGNTPYTEEGYFKLGRNLARTFLDYYKLNPVVAKLMQMRCSPSVPRNGLLNIKKSRKKSGDKESFTNRYAISRHINDQDTMSRWR